MIKKNEDMKDYHASSAIGRSNLFKISKSPLHYKYNIDNRDSKESKAFVFGRAFHTLVLEPEKWSDEYIIAPKIDKRTKEGKAALSEISLSGKTLIDQEDFDKMQLMSDSINSNKYAKRLLDGEHEVSYYWQDEFTGLNCKCRCDCRVSLPNNDFDIIVDVKTCTNAETEHFVRDSIKYGYDLQSAMYSTGISKVENKPHKFVFIAIEKEAPFAVNILEADELLLKRGYDLFREYLGTVKGCENTGNWYGYNGFSEQPNLLGLPSWLAKDFE